MTRKKHHNKKRKQAVPCLLFTQETLHLTRQALLQFEAYLSGRSDELPNTSFGKEVLVGLKQKLASLASGDGWKTPVSFDQNEVLILDGSLQLRLLTLSFSFPQNKKEIEQCTKLRQYFQSLLPQKYKEE